MDYSSKFFVFQTTSAKIGGPVAPPTAEDWRFVSMQVDDGSIVVLWAKATKR